MYLEFISDIVKVGSKVVITTCLETIEGVIVKLSNDLIAIQQKDGTVIVKKDNDITNIEILPADTKVATEKVSQSKPKVRCGMTLIKNDKVESFTCSICGKSKTSKKYAIDINNPNSKICNSCYGWTLARIENK